MSLAKRARHLSGRHRSRFRLIEHAGQIGTIFSGTVSTPSRGETRWERAVNVRWPT
jgi:hypothetical protein